MRSDQVLVQDILDAIAEIRWDEVYRTATNDIPALQSQIQAIFDSLSPAEDETA